MCEAPQSVAAEALVADDAPIAAGGTDGRASALPPAARWTCPKCDEVNKAERETCNSCGGPSAARVADPPQAPTESNDASAPPGLDATPQADGEAGQPPEDASEPPPAPTKWICPKCDEPNKIEREVCNNCNQKKPKPAEKWTCPKCDEPNRNDRDRCNMCGWVMRTKVGCMQGVSSRTPT